MVSIPDPLAVAEFAELCRLCGAKTSVLMGLHIFEREGSLREIYKKIKACLPIEVTNGDKLPKMVCEECVYKLDALYDFREKSVKTEYILNSMMKGLYATPPSNQQFSPPHGHSLDDLMCASSLHPADALHSSDAIHAADTIHSSDAMNLRSQVEVDLTNSANHMDSMIVTLPIVSSSGNIKCEGDLGELKAKAENLMARSIDADTNDSLVTVADVDHSSDNCTITEHIVNNIQVADVRTLQNITATELKGDGTEQGRHFLMTTHTEQPWFFCDICGKPFGDSNEFQAHCEIHWKKCHLCGVTCANDDALMLHLRESHNTTVQQLQNHQPPPQHQSQQQQQSQLQQQLMSDDDHSPDASQLPDTDFEAQVEEPRPGSSDPLNGPINSTINSKPPDEGGSQEAEKVDVKSEGKLGAKTCNECGKEYRTNYKLAEHMRKHTGEKPFKCSMCEKTFRSKIGLAQHEARHTGHYDYTCNTCGKGFQCKSYLIVHQRVHSDLKPYPCETCGRPFKTKQSLLDHQNRHLGVKPYICEVCGRGFITKGLCRSHQKVHSGTDNRQYPCSVCSKLFVSKSYLATHMRIHTGEKPFMCEVCGKGFLTRVDLKIHSTMHTGEKSFVCEVCGKAFARRDALRCHKRSHTGERPYKCDICGQGFTQFSPMAIHKRLHTGERPYSCDICSKTFVSRSTMMSHRKKHVGS